MNHFHFQWGVLILIISALACNINLGVDTGIVATTATNTTPLSETGSASASPLSESSATLPPPTATDTSIPPPTATDTPIPSATNTPAPNIPDWPLFKQGGGGPRVYAIQLLLRFHGLNLSVDGAFGPQTRTAVIHFQSQKGLSPDGIVGPQTWSALIQGALVKPGSHGDPTRAAQHLLNIYSEPDIAIDGIYSPQTANAITTFQQNYNLLVDGIVGAQTWQALVAFVPGT